MDAQKFDLISPEFKKNPFPTLAAIREVGDIVRIKMPLVGNVWMTSSYAATVEMLRDQQRFVQQAENAGQRGTAGMKWWMPKSIKVLTNNMLLKDEPDHRRLRGLVEQAFLRHSIEEFRPRIEAIVDDLLDQIDHKAKKSNSPIDLVEYFARPFPVAVICELLGLPDEDRPMFSAWAKGITNTGSAFSLLAAVPRLWKMNKYFQKQFESCRTQPRDGLISSLVAAEQDGHQLSEDELLAMGFLLLFAGHETTVHSLSGSIWALLNHKEQLDNLKSDWSQVETAVDELLRYLTPVQMTKVRYAANDMEFFGQKIKRGEYLIGLLAAANSDPAKFEQAEQLNITRSPNSHLAFGWGIHICLGLKLAKAELEIALEKLFTRYPNLEFGVSEQKLIWAKKIGLRSLKELPARMNCQK